MGFAAMGGNFPRVACFVHVRRVFTSPGLGETPRMPALVAPSDVISCDSVGFPNAGTEF